MKPVIKSIQSYRQTHLIGRALGWISILIVPAIIAHGIINIYTSGNTNNSWLIIVLLMSIPMYLLFIIQSLVLYKQVNLYAFQNKLRVTLGIWPRNQFDIALEIPADDIESIRPLTDIKYSHLTDTCSKNDENIQWESGQIIVATNQESISAVEVITKKYRWLIGCNNPHDTARKLLEIYKMKKYIQKTYNGKMSSNGDFF